MGVCIGERQIGHKSVEEGGGTVNIGRPVDSDVGASFVGDSCVVDACWEGVVS